MEQETTQVEQPTEETSEATSTEKQPTSERTYTEDEFRKLQSTKDAEVFAAQRQVSELQRQIGTMDGDYKSSLEELRQLQTEIERKEDDAFAGDEEKLSAARLRRTAIQKEREVNKKLKDLERREAELGEATKQNAIASLSNEYGVDANLLANAVSYEHAESIAKAIKVEREKILKTIPKQETPQFDTGRSDVVASSDETFMKLYSEGKSDDHARAQKILQKMK